MHDLKQRLKEVGQLEEDAQSNNDEAALERYQRERMEINQKLKKKLWKIEACPYNPQLV